MAEDNAARELATAALLSSRLCHDLIGPVGALANGLEVLADETDAEMRGYAMDLIGSSAKQATAKLKFARLAFGAGSSAGDQFDMTDVEAVVQEYIATTKATLVWDAPAMAAPKDAIKLLMNFILMAVEGIPLGGEIKTAITQEDGALAISVHAEGKLIRFEDVTKSLLAGEPVLDQLDPRSIQAYYAALISRAHGANIAADVTESSISLSARYPLDTGA